MNLIGAWADSCQISMKLWLEEHEREALSEFARERPDLNTEQGRMLGPVREEVPQTLDLSIGFFRSPGGGGGTNGPNLPDPWWTYFQEMTAGGGSRLGQFDFIPADRSTNRSPAPTLDPASLSDNTRDNDRNTLIQHVLFGTQSFTFPPVAATLATADYLDYLSTRGGEASGGNFDAIADAFFGATGKRIERPTANPLDLSGTEITVTAGDGVTHQLAGLSSGEIEFLSLAIHFQRVASEGGVLVVDEPETHLHPGLQQALLDLLHASSERAQIWLLTHSPNLVRTAADSAVLHLLAASEAEGNQIQRSSDQVHRDLLGDLGVHPSEVQQSSLLVIVEGKSDQALLRRIFPSKLARSAIIPASGVHSVEEISRQLADQDSSHVAIRDRDLLTPEEIEDLESNDARLFIWPSRTIESELLSFDLLHFVTSRSNPNRTEDEVRQKLRELADEQRQGVLGQVVQKTLRQKYPGPRPTLSSEDSLLAMYAARVACEQERLDATPEVFAECSSWLDSVWDEHHLRYVDAKRLLAQFSAFAGFADKAALEGHLVAAINDHPDLTPPGLEALGLRIADLLTD